MQMPGGGPWNLNPGQCTDDSELALCLMKGLAETSKVNTLDMESIAHWYKMWMHSPPFDIGTTTIRTIGLLKKEGTTAVSAK